MLNIEYAPSEMGGDILDSLENREHDPQDVPEEIHLGLSEDLTCGYRLGNDTRVLVWNAEMLLQEYELGDGRKALLAEAGECSSLVLIVIGNVFAPASSLTFAQRANVMRDLMKDTQVNFLALEDEVHAAEMLLAYARLGQAA